MTLGKVDFFGSMIEMGTFCILFYQVNFIFLR